MGIFEKLFGKDRGPERVDSYFRLLDGYTPHFRSFDGQIYESELVRASIDAIARHASKLSVVVQGSAKPRLRTQLKRAPNTFTTWGQFLYRLSTILMVKNNAFIVPIIDRDGETTGIYPICPVDWELVQVQDVPYIRFHFQKPHDPIAIELSRVGIMTRFQYRNDLFGESNKALTDTMDLIEIQRQGIEESAKNAATYRLMARVTNFTKPDDLSKERQRFDAENFQRGGGGILLMPNTYTDIKQLQQQAYAVDAEQLKTIKDSVYSYFGVNDQVLQNSAVGDAFNAFYEGCLEPFAIQASDVLTKMLYSEKEQASGAGIYLTANRLQYMTNADKLNVSSQMLDRGLMSLNEVRDIWQLPPVDCGDVRIIRGEYYSANEKLQEGDSNNDND